MNRSSRAKIAQETLEILERGSYVGPSGSDINIADPQKYAEENSALYKPDMFDTVFSERNKRRKTDKPYVPRFEVVNQTTLSAARERVTADPELDLLCLNFASAKNPGGGFLGGSRAQEESLARSSGLYPCINQMQEMYLTNRSFRSGLYTDHMIYSPKVPVIRDDEGELLDEPYLTSFLTAPAVNAGAVRKNQKKHAHKIEPRMIERTEKLLSVAAIHGHDYLILGAWGCGVFKNDPTDVAQWFYEQLVEKPTFSGIFKTVVFAITDWSEEQRFIGPFEKRFL